MLPAHMTLVELVQHEAVLPQLAAGDRDGAIRELIAALAQCGAVASDDGAALAKAAIDRERKGSTGFGKGVAIPHVKHKCVAKPVAALGISSAGIDFKSLDGQPVYSVILLLSPDSADQHLAAMNLIWPKLNNDRFRKFLRQARSRQEIVDLLHESQSM
jgi:mannitol/fructose-specific phosphotransferase system IIA component (Ntr-type)